MDGISFDSTGSEDELTILNFAYIEDDTSQGEVSESGQGTISWLTRHDRSVNKAI